MKRPISSAQTTVAVNGNPIEDRGGVLLLIDETLYYNHPTQMNQIVKDLRKDLVGDGWRVYVATAPRHTDGYSPDGFRVNNFNKQHDIRNKKIGGAYTNNAVRTVLMIGHVVIPYSGYHNRDGHGQRSGPADLYFGDLDGVWADDGYPETGGTGMPYDEERQYGTLENKIYDGKMNQSFVPANSSGVYNGLELAVGRVDFARMPAPYNTAQAEVDLIQSYFAKARKFRNSIPPYPIHERGVLWSYHWTGSSNEIAFSIHQWAGRFLPVVGSAPSARISGVSFNQLSQPYLTGFTGGFGEPIGSLWGHSPETNGPVRLLYYGSDFLLVERMPRIALNFFFGSYHWDWNLAGGTHRSLISMPEYGFASIWNQGDWLIESLAVGETLGSTLLKNVQAYIGLRTDHPAAVVPIEQYSDATYLNLLGDPTLRLRFVRPPSNVRVENVTTLRWDASSEPMVQYLAYKLNPSSQIYERVTNSAQPVGCCEVTLTAQEAQAPRFMVRATKPISGILGTYQELSQGAVYPSAGSVTLQGQVIHYGGDPVPPPIAGVLMDLSGYDPQSMQTGGPGTFSFQVLAGDHTLTPGKDIDFPPANGVTSLDITLIRRHILGIESLNSPYKLLAADVNNSSTVTTLDIAFINQLILGNTNKLPAGLWKFVRSDFVFPYPDQPWAYPSNRVYVGLTSSLSGQDFVAIKLGDVNHSWLPPSGGGESSSSQIVSSGQTQAPVSAPPEAQVVFEAGTVQAKRGGLVSVAITAQGFARVTSAQFTLLWDPAVLRLNQVEQAALPNVKAENFGILAPSWGILTFAWDSGAAASVSLRDGAAIFTIQFEVLASSGKDEAQILFADQPTLREVTVDAAPVRLVTRDGLVRKSPGGTE